MSETIIRPATVKDIPRIIELDEQLVFTKSKAEADVKPTFEDYVEVLNQINATNGYELLVAEVNGVVLGAFEFLIMPNLSHRGLPWAMVENVIVDEKHRREHVGKVMMEYAIKRAREAGCHKILLTSDNRRTWAHAFYKSLGFDQGALGFSITF